MSKEHYISPEEFDKLVDRDILLRMCYTTHNTVGFKYAQRVIDALRPINAKDPGFKYSCRCTDEFTVWLFGYTDYSIRKEADAKCKQIVLFNRIERGDDPYVINSSCPEGGSACSCPFDV